MVGKYKIGSHQACDGASRNLLSDLSLLIVDDVLPYAEYLASMASNLGAEVDVATTGAGAIGKFTASCRDSRNRARVRVALVDIMLPDIDGISTANELLRIDPWLKLVLSSAGSYDAGALGVPTAGFLKKPFPPSAFAELLGAFAGNQALMADDPERAEVAKTEALQSRYLSLLRGQHCEALAALHRRDYPAIAVLAHRLKGSAPLYGYEDLARHAGRLETTLKTEDMPAQLKDAASDDFLKALERTCAG
jgi:CheY-like chemotaxis protein